MPLPIITARLRLEPPTLEDAEGLLAVYSDPEVVRFLHAAPAKSVRDVAPRLARRIEIQDRFGFTFWTARLRESGEVIGGCGIKPLEEGPLIEVGYHFGRAHWGKGYATEGAIASLRFGFEEAGLDRIVAVYAPANVASGRVMERAGMRKVGPSRAYDTDVILYEALRSKWRPPRHVS
ncbi:MAG: GNAT family N-acetyltransferase [Planctomycetota bacterium]|nr:GNAT family N-acetyltransferase [Planctomycetota bacterium]